LDARMFLLLSGVYGALSLRMRRGHAAALSWLTWCVVGLAGFRSLLIYDEWLMNINRSGKSNQVG
jgi:hypothetical protein